MARTVLVVDDDDDVRTSICDLLRDAGYRALEAKDGSEVFDVLGHERTLPDAVVLDLMMPVMNGWEVIEVLKSDHHLSELPVIVVTAHHQANVPEADSLVFKPFEPNTLLAALAEQMN
ncbi:MAG: response regulator [Myxococcaceae bacterium]